MELNVTYFILRDFPAIRITCHHDGCGMTLELPPSQVEAAMKKTGCCCPVCGKPFTKPTVEGGADMVTQLAKVMMALNSLGTNVGIELPVVSK